MVTLDRALVEQIEELLRRQAGEGGTSDFPVQANGTSMLRRPKVESRLTPREVQALLRTGRSVTEVAEAAAMSEDWVGRFAPPVLAEQARVVERATGLTYSKPRIGPSIQPLGESVVWNLAERGVILSGTAVDDAWSAFQNPDGGWVVRVSYLAERRRQHADWTVDMAHGALKALNRLGNELGYVEPGRRRPQALPPATPVSASAQRAAAAPPKLTPPPPLPPRPTGRLSLLGASAGVSRQGSSSIKATGRGRDVAPGATSVPVTPAAATEVEATPAPPDSGAPEAAPPVPKPRRPRPLRPLSADDQTSEDAAVPPSAGGELEKPQTGDTGARNAPDASGGGGDGDAASNARTRRERPLRAPSRIRRDELAGPPSTVTRRSVVTPPAVSPGTAPPSPGGFSAGDAPQAHSGPESVVHRFGPAHSPAERTVSTAERFGIGRRGQTAPASKAVAKSTSGPLAAVAEPRPEEPEADNHHEPVIERPFEANRPLRARGFAPEPEARPDTEFAPEVERPLRPDADEVYQAFADLGADDPVTAPVPALDMLDEDDSFGAEAPDTAFGSPSAARDQVLIRAGQAGSADRAPGDVPKSGRSGADERPARPARLKLRRRPQGSP